MDQMAENTPEVEIETDTSEQIPDDVELAEEVETEDGSESSGNDAEEDTETDDDESEQEFYFGDEKLDSPTSEDGAEHGLVKHLRKTIKEKDRELKELMRQSQKPVEQQPVITQPPRMPKLDDEDIGFDEEIYQQRMAKWAEENGKYQEQVRERKREEEARTATLQQKAANYMQRVKALKVAGLPGWSEQAVREDVPVHIQDMILLESEKPEIVVLALGRNAELRKQLAEATNPVAIGRLLERIESKARIMPKAKTTAATTPTVKGSNGAVINNLDKLKAKALETGDWTPYFAAKKAKK
ncbi:scaffolding protein [Salmonella enterica]